MQVISTEGLHQLHIFIFVMAIVHVLYSAFTVLVGLWQVRLLFPSTSVLFIFAAASSKIEMMVEQGLCSNFVHK